jgi:hypothetical protein
LEVAFYAPRILYHKHHKEENPLIRKIIRIGLKRKAKLAREEASLDKDLRRKVAGGGIFGQKQ